MKKVLSRRAWLSPLVSPDALRRTGQHRSVHDGDAAKPQPLAALHKGAAVLSRAAQRVRGRQRREPSSAERAFFHGFWYLLATL